MKPKTPLKPQTSVVAVAAPDGVLALAAPPGTSRKIGLKLREKTRPPTRPEFKQAHDYAAGDMALGGALTGAMVADRFHLVRGNTQIDAMGGVSIDALAGKIERLAAAVKTGDLSGIEELLIAQAVSLNSIYAQYAIRSANVMTQSAANTLLAVAMKAQASSRAAMDSLVALKQPRQVFFAKQANVNSGGQQQVNNGAPISGGPPTPASPEAPVVVGGEGGGLLPSPRARTRKRTTQTERSRS